MRHLPMLLPKTDPFESTFLGWLTLVLFAALSFGQPALATCPIDPGGDDGIGGTGVSDIRNEKDGFGGTGVIGREADGVGGTGLWAAPEDGDGIGGTGVLGTITGLGSICVNGRHIDYTASTPVEANRERVSSEYLAVGQVVRVLAVPDGERLDAKRIEIRYEVVGPIEYEGEGRLRILGQPTLISPGARFDPSVWPATGTQVAVSGLRRPDGTIVATRVSASGGSTSLRGRVSVEPDGEVRVAELRVEWPAGAVPEPGARYLVTGKWQLQDRRLVVERVEREVGFSSTVERVDIEGYVDRREADALRVAGMRVETSAVQELPHNIERGDLVRIRARVAPSGEFRAKSVRKLRSEDLMLPAMRETGDTPNRRGSTDRRNREGNSATRDGNGRSDRAERTDRAERSERPQRPERAERPERRDRD